MNPKKTTLLPHILLLTIFLVCSISYAQEKSIGISLGVGSTEINESNSGLLNQKQFTLENYKLIEFSYNHKPDNAPFLFKTGIMIDNRTIEDENYNLSYIRVPLGLDFVLGNKFQFVFGGGLYVGTMIHSKEVNPANSVSKFQFGAEVNAGINFKLNDKLRLLAAYQINRDIAKTYDQDRRSPGGTRYQEKMIGSDFYIKLGLSYLLIPAN